MGLFGSKFPDTDKLEKQEKNNKRLYQEVLATGNSKELAEYLELKDEINSPEFIKEKARIEGIIWKKTTEFSKLKEFETLSKNKDLKAYFALIDSSELNAYLAFKAGETYNDLNDKKKRKSSAELQRFFRFENSKPYKSYQKINDSSILKRFDVLKSEVESEAFKTKINFLQNKHRWNTTEGAEKEKILKKYSEDKDIKNYITYHNSSIFDLYKNYEVSFAEDFAPEKLDNQKWKTEFYLGSEYGPGNYSAIDHLQAYSNGRNIEILRDYLDIETRQEQATARVWHPQHGFIQKEMEFTSGVISTGKSFKQNEGIFKIKLKTDSKAPLSHSVQLVSPKGNIQIKVLQVTAKGKPIVGLSIFDGKRHTNRSTIVRRLNLNSKFHIASLEWQKEMLIWKINDVEVFRTEIKLPKTELFLEIASVMHKTRKKPTPGKITLDWIKAYSKTA